MCGRDGPTFCDYFLPIRRTLCPYPRRHRHRRRLPQFRIYPLEGADKAPSFLSSLPHTFAGVQKTAWGYAELPRPNTAAPRRPASDALLRRKSVDTSSSQDMKNLALSGGVPPSHVLMTMTRPQFSRLHFLEMLGLVTINIADTCV